MDESVEAAIRAHHEGGDLEAAVTAGLERYGPEVYGFLVARMRAPDVADDVFSQLAEDLWRSLEGFDFRCTFRSWMYVLARNAANRWDRTPSNQARRRVSDSKVQAVARGVRTRTRPYLRTDVKDRFAEMRRSLEPDDQTLLILRLNRKLSWNEIAHVLEPPPPGDDEALRRASARVRQRFQKLKRTLAQRAERDGLLEPDADG